ncbi:MAG TPA: BamA/TamA family outer membrane protein [Longimicrobiales bacterium]|nr:BamA/TamA family outer membrane protein [Longimicrobiales bacterium]
MAAARFGRAARLALFSLTVFGSAACAKPAVVEAYPHLEEYAGREIDEVEFVNPEPFSEDSLDTLTETEPTKCRLLGILPFCFPGTNWGLKRRHIDLGTIGSDLARLHLLYRQSGYFGTEVVPEIEEIGGEDGPVAVFFVVRRGDGVVLDSVVVEGTEGIADPDSLEAQLPLQPGDLFHLGRFLASADTVRRALFVRGHAYAEVLRNYSVDTIQDRATAWLVAVPGPRVVVDSIVIQGADKLNRGTALRHVTFEQGDLLQLRKLSESQRNLYELELVQFAGVVVAPDSIQLTPADSTTATVLIQLVEAPEHVVEASAGYGTIECGRLTAQWTDRSFLTSARRLSLTGSLSRIGIGEPTDFAGSSLCQAANDTVARDLDYRLAGELSQPYFFTPRNQIALGAWVERQSEPGLYQRTAQGARFNLVHRLAVREVLTGTVEAERRVTEAVPALYCYAFLVCDPADLAALAEPRWRNAIGVSWLRDRGNSPVDPTRGYVVRVGTQWATPLLGSSYDFVRTSADGSIYRPVRPGWVLAGRLRVGTFITDATIGGQDDFIAPEERFFAGGASSVRGFRRGELGPGIWLFRNRDNVQPEEVNTLDRDLDVAFIPSGGTSVAVTSVELRFPSPFLSDLTRMAAFVDAGTVGLEPVWKLTSSWAVTPGVGIRIRTPVGPARIDFAYNPYPEPRAPLFVPDPDTNTLLRVDGSYRPHDPGIWERFRIHVAVGQAF